MNLTQARTGWQALCACVVFMCLSDAAADDTARVWFERMSKAVEQLNYRGTFVYLNNNQLESMEVFHKVETDRVYERLISRSGPPREFIRDGEKFQCIVQARKEVTVDRWHGNTPLMSALPVYREELSNYYRFEHRAHNDQVAGRNTVYLGIVPTDNYRYGYRLWLDEQTAMPLICELIDPSGKVIETMQFTAIEFDPKFSDDAFKPTLDTNNYRWITPAAKTEQSKVAASKWQAERIPKGFELSASSVEVSEERQFEHHVYSDGLASVSVFAESRGPDDHPMNGAGALGTTNAFGRIEGDFQITVVGDVPVDTIKIIGNSFRPKQ